MSPAVLLILEIFPRTERSIILSPANSLRPIMSSRPAISISSRRTSRTSVFRKGCPLLPLNGILPTSRRTKKVFSWRIPPIPWWKLSIRPISARSPKRGLMKTKNIPSKSKRSILSATAFLPGLPRVVLWSGPGLYSAVRGPITWTCQLPLSRDTV